MCSTPCQIQVQVGQDNDRTYESLFFTYQKKKKKKLKTASAKSSIPFELEDKKRNLQGHTHSMSFNKVG
jgi:hypothetical protein